MTAAAPLIVEVERSGLVESTHVVDVAIAHAAGEPVAWAGDPATIAYLRSAAKPVQATVCLESGWEPTGTEQLAVACASHNGERPHVEAVRGTLAAAGLTDDALRCPPAWPTLPDFASGVSGPAPILHNCSGKHAAMLAASVANGWPLDDYPSAAHPMQDAVAARLEVLAGTPVRIGVDGCGVPTFAFSLAAMARAYAATSNECVAALDAMAAHPFLVAGTRRFCTAIIGTLPGVVVKIGAEGLLCGVLRDRELGFALKSRDGAARAREVATLAVLRRLGAVSELPESLASFEQEAVTGGGSLVGSIRCLGSLEWV